jgi:hypothetical protein
MIFVATKNFWTKKNFPPLFWCWCWIRDPRSGKDKKSGSWINISDLQHGIDPIGHVPDMLNILFLCLASKNELPTQLERKVGRPQVWQVQAGVEPVPPSQPLPNSGEAGVRSSPPRQVDLQGKEVRLDGEVVPQQGESDESAPPVGVERV